MEITNGETIQGDPFMVTNSNTLDDCKMDCANNKICVSVALDLSGTTPECRLYSTDMAGSVSIGSTTWRKSCEPGIIYHTLLGLGGPYSSG